MDLSLDGTRPGMRTRTSSTVRGGSLGPLEVAASLHRAPHATDKGREYGLIRAWQQQRGTFERYGGKNLGLSHVGLQLTKTHPVIGLLHQRYHTL